MARGYQNYRGRHSAGMRLLIILLAMTLRPRIDELAAVPGFEWMQKVGPNLIAMFIVFALLYWVSMARITRSQVLVLKESEYVTAARALGAKGGRIIKRHLLPNCIPTLIITITMGIPSAILSEASLSFLGLGVRAPMSSWGDMISASRAFMGSDGSKWFYSFFPGLCMIVAVIAFNTLGDGLRDAFDPRMKR